MYNKLIKSAHKFLDPLQYPGVVSVGIGKRVRRDKQEEEICLVIGVKEKKLPSKLPWDQLIPRSFEAGGIAIATDVQRIKEIKALDVLTGFRRPCPGGYSIGHEAITAGTLGGWIEDKMVSNNHVLANSNEASTGDRILQPGKYDGGQFQIARLSKFVPITFEEEPKKKLIPPSAARLFWKSAKGLPNWLAELVDCQYRLRLVNLRPFQEANVVDAAYAQALEMDDVDPNIEFLGPVNTWTDLALGDQVVKVGRTTGKTEGYVDQINASVRVSYGDAGNALFEDQVIIRANSGEFSAGGDSGSWIVKGNSWAGLLFAGGDGTTIANRAENVINLLGLLFPRA